MPLTNHKEVYLKYIKKFSDLEDALQFTEPVVIQQNIKTSQLFYFYKIYK